MLHFIGKLCFPLASGLYFSAASTQDYSLSVRIKAAVGQSGLEACETANTQGESAK